MADGTKIKHTETTADLSTLPIAVEGKVKALEWEDCGEEMGHCADTVVGRYWVELVHAAYQVRFITMQFENPYFEKIASGLGLENAKAAAQSDYESRILLTLVSSPGKDGGKEVEERPVGYGHAPEMQSGKGGFWVSWEESNSYDTPVYARPNVPKPLPSTVLYIGRAPDLLWLHPDLGMLTSAADGTEALYRRSGISEEIAPENAHDGNLACPCTTFQQDEDCEIGYPSLLCSACEGKGIATVDKVVALAAEMMKVAEQVDELEDPFAAWETIDLIKSQNERLTKALDVIAKGDTTVFDDDLQCEVEVSMDEDEMRWIAKSALAASREDKSRG